MTLQWPGNVMQKAVIYIVLAGWLLPAIYRAADAADGDVKSVDWTFDRLDAIAGHKPTILGAPRLVDTPQGKAIEFDGKGDGLFLNVDPLTGLTEFTAEVIFQPAEGGPKEQRFLHFQENGTENRLLFEIRVIEGNRWFLDAFIKSGEGN